MNKGKPLAESEWFACEACDRPRTNDELSKGAEPYGESYFCNFTTGCDNDGELEKCVGCFEVFKAEDTELDYNGKEPRCYDCQQDRLDWEQMNRDREWDYWHA